MLFFGKIFNDFQNWNRDMLCHVQRTIVLNCCYEYLSGPPHEAHLHGPNIIQNQRQCRRFWYDSILSRGDTYTQFLLLSLAD
jgi:hypothetical protein